MNTYLKFFPIILLLLIYAVRIQEILAKRQVIKGEVQEKATFRLFMLCGLIVLVGGSIEYIVKGMIFSPYFPFIGVGIAIISFKVRRAAIKALGEFWSLHVEIREAHKFVKNGPFRWMRHPTYFSMILELLAGILICQAWISGLIAFIVFVPAMKKRLTYEEKALIQKFGDDYKEYSLKTPILFPTFINEK